MPRRPTDDADARTHRDPGAKSSRRRFTGRGGGTKAPRGEAISASQGKAGWFVKGMMITLCLLWIIPAVGVIITSFRSTTDAQATGWWHVFTDPSSSPHLTLENYHQALSSEYGMGTAFVNSFAITLPATVIPIMIAAFAAYAFTFMEFKGRDTLFILLVSLLVVPNQVAFLPMLKLYPQLGLGSGVASAFASVWLFHAGVRDAPGDLPSAQLHVDAAEGDHRVGQRSTVRRTSRRSGSSSSRCRPRRWPRSRSSSSFGSGTTCWSP